MRVGWKFALTAIAVLVLSLPARADDKPAPVKKPDGGKSVVEVDLNKLPPEVARQIKKALAGDPATKPVKQPPASGDGVKKPIKKPAGDQPIKKPDGNKPIKKPAGDQPVKGTKLGQQDGPVSLGQAILMFEKGGTGKVTRAEVKDSTYVLDVVLPNNTKATVTLDLKGQPNK